MDETEVKLDVSDDFANIDDLLDDMEEDIDPEAAVNDSVAEEEALKVESSISLDDCDDGFANDRPDNDLNVMALMPKQEDSDIKEHAAAATDLNNVFSSGLLDDLLGQKMEVAKRNIFPLNLAMEGISDVSEGERDVIEQQIEARETLEGLRAGLGQQQKQKMKMRMGMLTSSTVLQSAKAKTLAMKRERLEEDILKYGTAAIEKLYPRQQVQQVKSTILY